MLRYFITPLLFLMVLVGNVNSQPFTEKLDLWHQQNPIQKTYLHFDREAYFSGQTMWFKAYFISDFLPSAKNSTLFVELLNNQSVLVLKKVLPVFGALSYGQFNLPDSLPTGSYQIRAYTPLMLNFDKSYLYSRRVMIYGKNKTQQSPRLVKKPTLLFFPEGGNWVAGIKNNMAFKATDEKGAPANLSGIIKKSDGTTVTQWTTQHDGMGSFSMTPEMGTTYLAEIQSQSSMETFPLPPASGVGLALSVEANGSGRSLLLEYRGEAFKPAYLVGQVQHQVIIKQALPPASQAPLRIQLQTTELPSGVMQLTLFNKDGMPLAERLLFVDNKEYLLQARLQADTLNTGYRKKNHFSIILPDSITGNFSVSVTDADYEPQIPREQNIISSFLLSSDIPGYIHNPAYYFSNQPNGMKNLDLVMRTNGWRRFLWSQVTSNSLPAPIHKDPGFISLSGKVEVAGTGKSFADRELLVWVATDSGRSLELVKTDAQGRFKMDSMIFFDKARVLFSDIRGKKNAFLTVSLNSDSLYRSFNLPALTIPLAPEMNAPGLANKMKTAWFDYSLGEGLMLDSVLVRGKKTRLDQLEETYMSGLFAGGINAKTFDLTRENIPQLNIFDYLVGRIPSLNIIRDQFGGSYKLFYRQSGTREPVTLYLDEMPTDAEMISTIPANQIALVKLFPQFVGAPGGGAGGVLAIYTKRGTDLNEAMESSADIVDYQGYSIMKEFYAPDYSQKPPNDYRDYRLTLDWKPEIFLSGKNLALPIIFFNNDRTKRFKVVAEGITHTGQFLMLEKWIP